MDTDRIKKAVEEILIAIGEDPSRPGLVGTPERVAQMYAEILCHADDKVPEIMSTTHELEHDEMVIIKDIPFYSMCEHHLIPFFGMCHIAYIPKNKRIIGLSRLARIVDAFSKKPQVQERFSTEIAEAIMEHLQPKGAGVVVRARHLCMEMRGINRPGTETITSVVRGIFRSDVRTRDEFLKLIQ